MKTFFTLIFALFSTILFAQGNFKVENGQLIWQKIYDGPNAPKEIDIENSVVNYKPFGGTLMSLPIYMRQPFNAKVEVEKKEDRYRVTVSQIIFQDLEDFSESSNSYTPLQSFVISKTGEFKKSQIKALGWFDMDLNQRFQPVNDNW